ncbi:hypothetical protein M0804_013953 [Polistes exclamans]|nr:hypothetical protein M0804_013953 [Polistes exclamans]
MILKPMQKIHPGYASYAQHYKQLQTNHENIETFSEENQLSSNEDYFRILKAGIIRPKVFLKRQVKNGTTLSILSFLILRQDLFFSKTKEFNPSPGEAWIKWLPGLKLKNSYTLWQARSQTKRQETTSEYMDTDDFNTRDDATKERKFNPSNSYLSLSNLDEPQEKWLSKIPVSNQFSRLQEVEELPRKNTTDRITPQPKPPPIHIEAQVIVPLIELLKEIVKDEYTLKQLKDNHIKVQVNTSNTNRKKTITHIMKLPLQTIVTIPSKVHS